MVARGDGDDGEEQPAPQAGGGDGDGDDGEGQPAPQAGGGDGDGDEDDATASTGTNDAAVITEDSVAEGTVTEGADTVTATGNLDRTDVDSENDVWQAVTTAQDSIEGFGTYTITEAGEWTYELAPENQTVNALAAGETLEDSFTAMTEDGTEQPVTITITGTNDAAVIAGDSVTEGPVTEDADTVTATGNLDHTDVDNDNDVWQAVATAQDSAESLGTYTITEAGEWTYELDPENQTVNALAAGATLEDSFTAMTEDGTEQPVTITITGTNDAAVIAGNSARSISKNVEANAITGDLNHTDVDNDNDVWQAVTTPAHTSYGAFTITSEGLWRYTLDKDNSDVNALNEDGTPLTDTFTVRTEDGTEQDVTVTITTRNLEALTSGRDVRNGDDENNNFEAPVDQSSGTGGVSNTLASGDDINGRGGDGDRLHAQLTQEFAGAGGSNVRTDIQPIITDVEEIDIQARDDAQGPVILDAKDITGHNEIGSFRSDGDLVIENLTTLDSDGEKRPTADITITMDHTDNTNTDGDASDLTVYFDDNYLIPGEPTNDGNRAVLHLLDEDAELARLVGDPANGVAPDLNLPRLSNIDISGIRVEFSDGTNVELVAYNRGGMDKLFRGGTHEKFVEALKTDLDYQISGATGARKQNLQDLQLQLDDGERDITYLDDGTRSQYIPGIVLTSKSGLLVKEVVLPDGTVIDGVRFTGPEDNVGNYDTYGRIAQPNEPTEKTPPVSVDIEVEKVGRGGDGGELIVGAKSQEQGIEVFNVHVKGDEDKPSNVERLDSTADALRTINIETHEDYREGDSFADLRAWPKSS